MKRLAAYSLSCSCNAGLPGCAFCRQKAVKADRLLAPYGHKQTGTVTLVEGKEYQFEET